MSSESGTENTVVIDGDCPAGFELIDAASAAANAIRAQSDARPGKETPRRIKPPRFLTDELLRARRHFTVASSLRRQGQAKSTDALRKIQLGFVWRF
jgi:hypothetical protein